MKVRCGWVVEGVWHSSRQVCVCKFIRHFTRLSFDKFTMFICMYMFIRRPTRKDFTPYLDSRWLLRFAQIHLHIFIEIPPALCGVDDKKGLQGYVSIRVSVYM